MRGPEAAGLTTLAVAGLLAVGGAALAATGEGEPTPSATDPDVVLGFDVTTMDPLSDADLRTAVVVLDLSTAVGVLDLSSSVRPWAEPEKQGDTTVVTISTDVLFGFGLSEIDTDGHRAIAAAVEPVPSGTSIAVTGYTDSRGGDEINGPLSQERADAVAAIIRAERPDLVVTAEGKGSADEAAPNTNADGTDNPEGRAKNRRVEIRYGG